MMKGTTYFALIPPPGGNSDKSSSSSICNTFPKLTFSFSLTISNNKSYNIGFEKMIINFVKIERRLLKLKKKK